MDGQYDVIIIGTGAGGGTLARHLAPSGKRILLLERGDWLPREPANWSTVDVFVDGRYISEDSWYDPKAKSFFQPQVHYFVGGATKLYGAALYRMRAEDFGELHHHDGLSPAWPISYEDMEPYYTAAEGLYQVHGARGEDPTDPPGSAPYPYPAVSHEPRIQKLSDDLAAAATTRSTRRAASWSTRRTCPTASACDAMTATASRARCTPSPTPRCGRPPCLGARQRDPDPERAGGEAGDQSGQDAVTQVVVERDGETVRYQGDIVVVACGAANSAKLLLASANDKHPNGLANGSDQVGRNFMYHDSQAVLALSKDPNPTVFQKTLGVNDYLLRRPGLRLPDGQHPDDRQVAGGDVPGREAAGDQVRAAPGIKPRAAAEQEGRLTGRRPARRCRCRPRWPHPRAAPR